MKSSTVLHYHKRILSVTWAFVMIAGLMMVMTGGGGIMPTMTTTQHQVFAQPADGGETSQAGQGQQPAANTTTGQATTIEMMATEMDETYRWAIDNNINPTLTLVADVNNTITVNNPTDAVHELVIATTQEGGEEGELAATRDVQPGGGQGELSIMPNATQSLRYYCEYHPQTMVGDILISSAPTMTNATTTMTNQTQ